MNDLISRQAAIELVKDVCDAIMSGCESRYDPETEDEVYTDIREVDAILKCNKEVRIALRNMPSAQPDLSGDSEKLWKKAYERGKAEAQDEPHWIPCSERLPEGKQEVLVTEYGDTDMGRRFAGRWVDRYGDKMKDVTAWMPLPEPYHRP